MAVPYSVKTVRALERKFLEQGLFRPFRRRRYEPGAVLEYEVRGVLPDGRGRVKLEIERFVGGGYAGQVYKTRLLEIENTESAVHGLQKGQAYALKILIPASGLSRRIRNLFYALGFQGPFSLQVTPAAGRSQALWQKFIRRAAAMEFGSPDGVVDIIATLVDRDLGGCGEISEWVDGRLWRFEVDDDLDARRAWKPGRPEEGLGSTEYRTKRAFMDRLVKMMRRMGAIELARQYEWWSLKSQPNALKRTASDPDPKAGLVAVDFRAGMALTPVTPQCPADIKLVFQGLARGRLVQFDKGDLGKLEEFVGAHPDAFAGMEAALAELKREDRAYRDSLIDFTYHHVRLFGSRLRRAIMAGFRESWRIRNMTDEKTAARLDKSGLLSLIFLLWPFLALATPALLIFAWPGPVWWKYPLWFVPLFLAPFLRRLWGRADLRRHYGKMAANPAYFLRASRARITEALIRWHRAGRVSDERALKIAGRPWRYYLHLPLSFLPVGLHRFLSDKRYFKERLFFIFIRPIRLYFKAEEREKWLLDMISQGERNHMLSRTEAARIASQIKEPFIQKYLKSMAVHICTLPVTQIVSITLAFIYVKTHPELTWQQASVAAGMILALFQVIPISPGSFARGLYTTFLVLRERNFKDYKVAFGLSYFKYIGYLAFPIQMAYRYPDLARFMAGHWSTGAVHIVPIFGEKGAWLEHFAFDLFYNFPLTIQRRMRIRAERRAGNKPRFWHIPIVILAGTAFLGFMDYGYFQINGRIPALGDIWWLLIWIPLFAAATVAKGAGGASVAKRIGWGVASGVLLGILCAAAGLALGSILAGGSALLPFTTDLGKFALSAVWQAFLFALISALGGFIAETRKVK
jgi:hypothetical protein